MHIGVVLIFGWEMLWLASSGIGDVECSVHGMFMQLRDIAEEAGDDGCTFGCLQWFSPVPQSVLLF